jgi:hypothetical protein
MTNDATRADTTSLPGISRRNALSLTATGIASALTGFAVATAAAAPSISERIKAHKQAWADLDAATRRLSDIEEANPIEPPRVQYGRSLVGLNDDGSDEWRPLYAYSEDEINRRADRVANVLRSIWCDSPNIADKVEQRRERLLAELREKQAEVVAAEASCGITEAEQEQDRASGAEQQCLDALIGHQFHTIEDIRLAASYLTDQHRAGSIFHSALVDFVKTLAGRAS